MITVRDVPAGKFIAKLADELNQFDQIKMPESLKFVKSGANAERPPTQENFWNMRSAAMMRKMYMKSPVGVEKFRTVFGSKKRRGHKPGHHYKAGGKMIRTMLQQLEAAGLVEKVEKPRKGRALSPKGRKFLDSLTKGMK